MLCYCVAMQNLYPRSLHSAQQQHVSLSELNSDESTVRMRAVAASTATAPLGGDSTEQAVAKGGECVRLMTRRLWMLVIAVTVHNIPEGLAVGIAFGGVGTHQQSTFFRAR